MSVFLFKELQFLLSCSIDFKPHTCVLFLFLLILFVSGLYLAFILFPSHTLSTNAEMWIHVKYIELGSMGLLSLNNYGSVIPAGLTSTLLNSPATTCILNVRST
jgi:hypothetical protein